MIATETRPVDPGDPYVDPPRNWKRVGLLTGVWVALWILVGAMGWLVMQVPILQEEARPTNSAESPTLAVDSFFNEVYSREDAAAAGEFACDVAGAPDAQTMINDRKSLETSYGAINVTWKWEPGQGQTDGDRTAMLVTLKYQGPRYTDAVDWQMNLERHDGWCVASMTLVPSPSGS
ncbi:hypothetical protein [Phytomonospora endophytica]|uniref:Uncharacterized protein n=1 Tax=Phytomonospora endophytica TaxID=714109 RepID=A0A841G0W8_9ACTN|nr:hypothetical protein [Phytomonospora endophytica]MBB6037810.1 hypothetical protein [Phytomonospora endophytica]